MGEIEADRRTDGVTGSHDVGHRHDLAGVVLHARQQYDGELVTEIGNRVQDVLSSKRLLPRARIERDE